jgi:hypothetical protein
MTGEGYCVLAKRVCPKTSDTRSRYYCPAWWETVWTNDKGETRLEKGCAWGQLPAYLNQFAKASSQASEAAVQARETTNQGLRAVALTLFGDLDAQAALRLALDSGPTELAGIRDQRPPDVPRNHEQLQLPGQRDDEPEADRSDRRSFDGWPTIL